MNPQDYIPKPCHEDWDTMSGDERKKFCQNCSCTVHNLTGMDHQQITQLKTQLGGKLCGAFHLKLPLTITASTLALTLAACQTSEPTTDTSKPTPPSQKEETFSTYQSHSSPPVLGLICLPPEPKE
jgi:hypothetical protein